MEQPNPLRVELNLPDLRVVAHFYLKHDGPEPRAFYGRATEAPTCNLVRAMTIQFFGTRNRVELEACERYQLKDCGWQNENTYSGVVVKRAGVAWNDPAPPGAAKKFKLDARDFLMSSHFQSLVDPEHPAWEAARQLERKRALEYVSELQATIQTWADYADKIQSLELSALGQP